jgi:ubiquinone biosynthesis protein
MAEVLQVLIRHGFADLVQRAKLDQGLPARVLRRLNLMNAPSGEPATLGIRMCAALTELGPTFVKLGQVLSTRPDLVGPDLANELSKLQDKVDPLPFDVMRPVIEESLGETLENLFSTFDPVPVAAASISQVYRATLNTGEPVAVKVQRPGIEKKIDADLNLMRQIAQWSADRVGEAWFDPVGVVDEFARSIRREQDLLIEARILEQFREGFGNREDIFVPMTYPALCHSQILTMDWVDGVRVDEFDAYAVRNCDRKTVANLGCEILCEMVFVHRLFHADPHPGNVFITHNNQIAFLDCGMAGHLERTDVAALADLFLAIIQRDSNACVSAILTLTTSDEPEDRQSLEHEIAEFIAFEAPMIVSGGQVARGIERAIEIVRRYSLALAPRFSMLLKALATIERVGHQLDPDVDVLPIIRPYVERLIVERYTPMQIMRESQQNAASLLRLSRQVPQDAAKLLSQLRRGKLKFRVYHDHLEQMTNTIDRASNRAAVAVVTGSLIIGSSMLIAAGSRMESLGIAGFIFAGFLGLYLVIGILWSKRY